MIISHEHKFYQRNMQYAGHNVWNGAYYYSKEICENIIPRVKTDRSWITVNLPFFGCDHAIVYVHNNMRPDHYR